MPQILGLNLDEALTALESFYGTASLFSLLSTKLSMYWVTLTQIYVVYELGGSMVMEYQLGCYLKKVMKTA